MNNGGWVLVGILVGALLSHFGLEELIGLVFMLVYTVMAFYVLRGLAWGFTRLRLKGRNR